MKECNVCRKKFKNDIFSVMLVSNYDYLRIYICSNCYDKIMKREKEKNENDN